jgi:hypothetical protein
MMNSAMSSNDGFVNPASVLSPINSSSSRFNVNGKMTYY